jgi:hypothetical protein
MIQYVIFYHLGEGLRMLEALARNPIRVAFAEALFASLKQHYGSLLDFAYFFRSFSPIIP